MLRSSLRVARQSNKIRNGRAAVSSSTGSPSASLSTNDDGRNSPSSLPLSASASSCSFSTFSVLASSGWSNKSADQSSQRRLQCPMQAPLQSFQQQRFFSSLTTSTSHPWRTLKPPLSNPLGTSHSCQPQTQTQRRHQQQQVRTKVFVSRHNDMNITSYQILEYCASRGIIQNVHLARVTSSHVVLKDCPFCSKPTNDKLDNQYKCYINIGGGAYFCHRCGSGGSWFDFKSQLRGYQHNVVSVHGGGSGGSTTKGNTSRNAAAASSKGSTASNGAALPPGAVAPLPIPKQRLQACYSSSLMDSKPATIKDGSDTNNNANTNSSNAALDYLQNTRGLELKTLRKYGVGKAIYSFPSDQSGQYVATECITFPWIMTVAEVKEQEELRGAKFSMPGATPSNKDDNEDGETAVAATTTTNMNDSDFITRRIKVRALEQKGWQRLDPAGGGWGLFGWHTVPDDAKEVVVTEGEYDAMAVWQATGLPAVSLPNGCRSLPMEVLPMLEKFQKIYLWMDNDGPGQEGAKKFAQKIGLNRCYMVQPLQGQQQTCKDANEALLKGLDLKEMINKATVIKHENVLDFESIRQDVLHEILHPDEYTGVPMTSLPTLTNIIKGYRRGELTILTGPTGSGKTTFLGQLSLDLAEQEVNVLWGSFEIKNTRLIQKLLQQFSRKPLPTGNPDSPAMLHQLADRFSSLPLYFMKFHGGSDLDDVLDAMEYAVYVSDVEHIILDNLQFMISRNSLNKSFDKFDIQDIAIEKFRKFATDRNVHVTLVVHPRKEDEATKLSISSIYGSAKATQEADTVMILQSELNAGRQRKYIEVKKNRYDGTLGYCPLHFDRMSARYEDNPIEHKAFK